MPGSRLLVRAIDVLCTMTRAAICGAVFPLAPKPTSPPAGVQESMNTAGRDPPAIEPIPVSGDETPIPPGVAVAAGVSEPGPTLQGLQTPITQGAGIVTDEPMADGVQDPSGGVTENKHVTASTKDEYGLLKSHAQVGDA